MVYYATIPVRCAGLKRHRTVLIGSGESPGGPLRPERWDLDLGLLGERDDLDDRKIEWGALQLVCPGCGGENLFQCGKCRKLTCGTAIEPVDALGHRNSTCAWCGNRAPLMGFIERAKAGKK